MKHWEGKFHHGLCIWENGIGKGGANPQTPVSCFSCNIWKMQNPGVSLMCFVSRTANDRQNLKQVTLMATVMPWWLQVIIGKIALRSSLIILRAGVLSRNRELFLNWHHCITSHPKATGKQAFDCHALPFILFAFVNFSGS